MWSVSYINGELVPCEWNPDTQRLIVLATLSELKEGYAVTGWPTALVKDAMESLIEGNLFVFVGDKVMCLSQCRPWFSAEDILTEEFVGNGIGLETVTRVMRVAASVMGVSRFVVGTRAAANQRQAGLARLYQREGLTVSTIELMGTTHEQENS